LVAHTLISAFNILISELISAQMIYPHFTCTWQGKSPNSQLFVPVFVFVDAVHFTAFQLEMSQRNISGLCTCFFFQENQHQQTYQFGIFSFIYF